MFLPDSHILEIWCYISFSPVLKDIIVNILGNSSKGFEQYLSDMPMRIKWKYLLEIPTIIFEIQQVCKRYKLYLNNPSFSVIDIKPSALSMLRKGSSATELYSQSPYVFIPKTCQLIVLSPC
jgi:hypothetical protein